MWMIDDPRSDGGLATLARRGDRHWSPGSWRAFPAAQQPDWDDPDGLAEVLAELSELPPLVLPGEVAGLRTRLAAAAAGEAMVLQAGDCAERFDSCTESGVRSKVQVLQHVAMLLSYGSGLPVVRVGRIAGQFGKPRSSPTEVVDGMELPVFRGDIVNDDAPTPQARRPDVRRLRRAYDHASVAVDVLRGLGRAGFADLPQVHAWNEEFVRRSPAAADYESAADDITRAVRFLTACGGEVSERAGVHTSHEALLPEYEQALTRRDPVTGEWFATSAHMLWIGDRTRDPAGAHVEFLSGVANPVGAKIGPSSTPDQVVALCDRLDPGRVPGRLVLIPRLGADRVLDLLPPLITAVRDAGHRPVWLCDPMHGNTVRSPSGYKTRRVSDIASEIDGFFAVHHRLGSHPGGLHLELTGEDVTECLGGAAEIRDAQLGTRYESACDPRLNADQSIELAFRVADLLHVHRTSRPVHHRSKESA